MSVSTSVFATVWVAALMLRWAAGAMVLPEADLEAPFSVHVVDYAPGHKTRKKV